MTSWCDKLASTPAIGFRFTPSFTPSEEVLSSMAPILNQEIDGERPTFNIETVDPFNVSFNTEEGYKFDFTHAAAAVTFNHRIRAKPSSAGPPTMELISQPAPYTELLDKVAERIAQAIHLLPTVKGRLIHRVGLVSLTTVHLEDAPPGITALFGEIGRPLGGKIDSFNVAITSVVNETADHIDRCVHTLALPDDAQKLATIQLDWQRSFTEGKPIAGTSIRHILDAAKIDSLSYFERVAEGGLNDGVDGNGND